MKLREALPVGHRRGPAFEMMSRGVSLEELRTPVYAVCAEARALSSSRRQLGLGLHEAAIKLGVRAIEVSELERGWLVPEDANDWSKMLEAMTR